MGEDLLRAGDNKAYSISSKRSGYIVAGVTSYFGVEYTTGP